VPGPIGASARLAPIALSVLLALPPPSARAADDATQPPVRALDKVEVIATPPADDRRESTTTRIVVPHDEIVRYGDTSLSDVLKRLPGVTIEGAPGRNGAVIRLCGLGNGYTQVLVNGEPVPPEFSIDSLQPSQIERIEILRAPTADLGARGITGTINIILRKSAAAARRNVKLTGGLEGSQPLYAVDADLADRFETWSWTLAAAASRDEHHAPSLAEQHGIDAFGNTDLLWITPQDERYRIERVGLTPRLAWKPNDGDTATLDSFFRFQRVEGTFNEATTTLVGAPPTFAADVLPYRFDTTTARPRLDWVHRWQDGSSLDLKTGISYDRRDGLAYFRAFDPGGTFVLDRSVTSRATNVGATAAGKYLTPIVEGHALALGIDTEYTQRDERRYQVDAAPGDGLIGVIDEAYRSRLTRAALYAQDEWNITPRWSAYWGLRYETLDTRTSGNVIAPVGNRSGVLSPMLQTLWKSGDGKGDQFRASLARTYKPPTTFQLTPRRYIANNNTATTPDFQGNPELRPELAWGLDVAWEHYFARDALVSVSAYVRRIDDVILTRLANVDGTWITFPANRGVADVQGIEAEVKVNLRTFRKSAPDVSLRANVAANRSRVEDVPGPDNRLDRQVPWSANAGFDWVLDGMPLTLGANFSYQGGGRVRTSFTEAEALPYRRVLDAYALWKFDRTTSLRLSVADLLAQDRVNWKSHFDETGELRLTTTSPTRTVVRVALEFAL
jgi:outer membrane receptor protein involved in Fe transport